MKNRLLVKIDKNNNLRVSCKLSKKNTFKIFENKKYKAIYVFNRPQTVSGVTNATEDNMGVLFIDYDNCDYEVVLEDLNFLARRFKLPPSYVFMTKKNNYHVINLKKFPNGDIPKLLRWTRCDHNYVNSPSLHLYRSYVLRLSGKVGSKKPKFKEIIGEMRNLNYEISKAHLDLLNKIYPKLTQIPYTNIDKGKTVKTQIYETSVGGD